MGTLIEWGWLLLSSKGWKRKGKGAGASFETWHTLELKALSPSLFSFHSLSSTKEASSPLSPLLQPLVYLEPFSSSFVLLQPLLLSLSKFQIDPLRFPYSLFAGFIRGQYLASSEGRGG